MGIQVHGELQNAREVQLFYAELGKKIDFELANARAQLEKNDRYAAALTSVIAAGYVQARNWFLNNAPDKAVWKRDELLGVLQKKIFPSGKGADDFPDNLITFFDEVVDALARGEIQGYERMRTATTALIDNPRTITGPKL
jgi:hypothetical protein